MIAFWYGRAISENQRIAPGARRFRADEDYQAFKESVAWTCKLHQEYFDGPVSVRLFMELNPRIDAQNVIKPVLDALELAGVIKNDKQVRCFSFYRENTKSKEQDSTGIIVTEAT